MCQWPEDQVIPVHVPHLDLTPPQRYLRAVGLKSPVITYAEDCAQDCCVQGPLCAEQPGVKGDGHASQQTNLELACGLQLQHAYPGPHTH